MRVAGLGFRAGATLASLSSALSCALAAAGAAGVTGLATAAEKVDHPAITALGLALSLPVIGVSRHDLSRQSTLTHSRRAEQHFATGSVAEAAALAAAGLDACLLGPRQTSADGMAVAAIAETGR